MAVISMKWMFFLSFIDITMSALISTCSNDANDNGKNCNCSSADTVEWFKNTTSLTVCAQATCIPLRTGYTFSFSNKVHTIDIENYDEALCMKYSCKDINSGESVQFPPCDSTTTTNTTTTSTTTTTSATTSTTSTTSTTAPLTSKTTDSQTSTNSITSPSNGNSTTAVVISSVVVGGFIFVALIMVAVGLLLRKFRQKRLPDNYPVISDDASDNRNRKHTAPKRSAVGNKDSQLSRTGNHSQQSQHEVRMNPSYIIDRNDPYLHSGKSSHMHDKVVKTKVHHGNKAILYHYGSSKVYATWPDEQRPSHYGGFGYDQQVYYHGNIYDGQMPGWQYSGDDHLY